MHYICNYSFIIKDTTQEQPKGREVLGEVCGAGDHRASMEPNPMESGLVTLQIH